MFVCVCVCVCVCVSVCFVFVCLCVCVCVHKKKHNLLPFSLRENRITLDKDEFFYVYVIPTPKQNIVIENLSFEKVEQFTYLGVTVKNTKKLNSE